MTVLPLFLLFILWPASPVATAAEPVTLLVNSHQPSAPISSQFIGLSYETSLLLPDARGQHYFSSSNQPLLAMFKTIGVQNLRIGGNSVDTATFPVPRDEDIRQLLDFAKAARIKLIYSVRLKEPSNSDAPAIPLNNAESAAKIAHFIHDHSPEVIDCFAIGNEPSYLKEYAAYTTHWKSIRDAILAVYPEATFCGPDQDPAPELDAHMVEDFGIPAGRLVKISQHTYPFGCSFKNPKDRDDIRKLVPVDAVAAREKMLSPAAYATYQKIYDGIAHATAGTPVTYCLSETNSFWFSGLKGASDSYASALWAADYLHWWAAHGAANVDFHTGDRTGGEVTLPCQYAAFVTSANGYEARPLAYGMKLFDLGGHGSSIPIDAAATARKDLSAYATLANDKKMYVTLINKSHGSSGQSIDVLIKPDVPLAASGAQVIYLRSKNDDISATAGDVTLGDAQIQPDGTWNGHWTDLPPSGEAENVIRISVPPATAAVVTAQTQ